MGEIARSPDIAGLNKWQGQRADPTKQRKSNAFNFTVANLRGAADQDVRFLQYWPSGLAITPKMRW